MTERERVLSILKHEKPDRLPWFADLAYWIHYLETDKIYPPQYRNTWADNGLQKLHRDMGTGFYLQGFQPWTEETDGWEIRTQKNGDTTVATIDTPVGELRQVAQYSHISYSDGIVEHFIKDIDDLKIFLWTVKHTRYIPAYELAHQRYETVGDNGVVLCYTPKSPLMHLLALYAGVEKVTYMALDDEEEFTAILDELEEKFDEACRITVDSPAECIMIPENISSECVVPFYKPYMKRYHQKWTSRIREAGKYSFVHQDGTVRGLISQLSRESHFDVIEAVTPLPVGDVEIAEVADLVDPDTIIWGGIPGGMFFEESCSDEEFDRHVLHCIDVMTKSPRYVLGVADQVVPRSSVRRIKRVRELVDQYGHYDLL